MSAPAEKVEVWEEPVITMEVMVGSEDRVERDSIIFLRVSYPREFTWGDREEGSDELKVLDIGLR
jgi:hypothetical protein